MRKVFGDYLESFKDSTIQQQNNPENTKAVVFCQDDRKDYFFPLILKNYREVLGEGWNFYIVTTGNNHLWMAEMVNELKFGLTIMPIQYLFPNFPHQGLSAAEFNTALLDAKFWEFFTEKSILITQWDCVLLNPIADHFFEYDYIGAPCSYTTLNGGLSLRHRETMIQACNDPESQDLKAYVPEDIYFTQTLRKMGANLPNKEMAEEFALESWITTEPGEYNPHPVGIHGTDHYYMDDTLVSKIINKTPIVIKPKPNVFIATPVYKWPPHPKFTESLQNVVNDPRMNVTFKPIVGDAHIERARSMLLEWYLRYEKPWDWFVMIDSDIEFNADIIWGMLNSGVDCIGAAYAFKSPEGTSKYRQPVIRPEEQSNTIEREDGLVSIRYLGGGFTILSDTLVKRMCEYYKDLEFHINPDLKQGESEGKTYGLWNPVMVEQPSWGEGKYEMLSEDYSFCERILRMDEKVWLDRKAKIAHWDGETAYMVMTLAEQLEQQEKEKSNGN
jgi:hypothetical protein